MIWRIGAAVLVLWALGFLWFAVALPGPAGAVPELAFSLLSVSNNAAAEGWMARNVQQ